MNIKQLIFLLSVISLTYSCREVCDDFIAHDFTETELEWFSYTPFDTLYFQNTTTGKSHYLTCISEQSRIITDIVSAKHSQ